MALGSAWALQHALGKERSLRLRFLPLLASIFLSEGYYHIAQMVTLSCVAVLQHRHRCVPFFAGVLYRRKPWQADGPMMIL